MYNHKLLELALLGQRLYTFNFDIYFILLSLEVISKYPSYYQCMRPPVSIQHITLFDLCQSSEK